MGEWWIDEAPYPGPTEYNVSAFLADIRLAAIEAGQTLWSHALAEPMADIKRAMLSIPRGYSKTLWILDEINYYEPIKKETTVGVALKYDELRHQLRSQEIGAGRVQGHGPRARSTFGRGGRKQY